MGVAGGEQVGDPVGQHPGLARAGAGDDQQRRAGVDDRLPLRRVEPVEQLLRIEARRRRPGRRGRAGADSARTGTRGCRREDASHGESMPPAGHYVLALAARARRGSHRTPASAERSRLATRNACAPGIGVGILDDVIGARFYFYYGTGSPAAVGRA